MILPEKEDAGMDSKKIDALIKEIRDRSTKYNEAVLAVGPNETDPEVIEAAQRAAELAAEYDSLLAIIKD
jgi:hypothetical protein